MSKLSTSILVLALLTTVERSQCFLGCGEAQPTQPEKKSAKRPPDTNEAQQGTEKKKTWKLQFTIGKETTIVTEPRDEDGYIDYAAALNERLRKNIAPETTANVLIWKALGPRPERRTGPAEYFRWLGIESPPDEGAYFIDLDEASEAPWSEDGGYSGPRRRGHTPEFRC